MKPHLITPSGVALLAALLGACTGDVPSALAPEDPALARAPAAYTALDIGALVGAGSSQANGVNDAGDVAGFIAQGGSYVPFAYAGGQVVTLGGGPGLAWGISNASPAYVAGSSAGLPVLWSLAAPTQPMPLEVTSAELAAGLGGHAESVNDAGAAVGSVGASAAMWSPGGARVANPIATPAGFTRGEGRGINDAGHAVFQFLGGSPPSIGSAYLRLATGQAIALPPTAGDVTSYANDISEVTVGVVYVAGSTESSALVSRAVRWTVDAATGAILATDVLATTESHGLGVSDAGGIAGFIDVSSFRFSSFLWRGTSVLKLGAPKGLKDPRAWALSRSGQYAAGQAYAGTASRAVRWTILSP